jgi:hypothetical protein
MAAINQFIKKRPYLVWYVKNRENLSPDSIVEAVLNYGDWDDVKELTHVLGLRETAAIFKKGSGQKRSNYREKTKNYFSRYFKKYAHA